MPPIPSRMTPPAARLKRASASRLRQVIFASGISRRRIIAGRILRIASSGGSVNSSVVSNAHGNSLRRGREIPRPV